MERIPLGPSDVTVSVFGLGTMTFGAEADEATSHALLDAYFEAGGRFIDTANVYSAGVSEEIVGTWLRSRGKRSEMVVATKARFPMSDAPEDRGAGRRHLMRAVDASLRRLQVEVIDLYQVHAWDPDTPLEETLGALDALVVAGKVRQVGVSNYTGWQLQRAVLLARHGQTAPPVSLQPKYSLLSREIELELLPLCMEEGLGVVVWSPLAGGWLSGKYSPHHRPEGATRLGEDPKRGIEAYDLRNKPHTWEIVEAARGIAAGRGVSPTQVALNWVRQRPGITSVLLGARTVAQLNDNLGALSWRLDEEEMLRLNLVSAPGIPIYPHGFLERYAGVEIWERLTTRSEPPPIGR